MATRIAPAGPDVIEGDPELGDVLDKLKNGFWEDNALGAVIARRPKALKGIVRLIDAAYNKADIDPVTVELMRRRSAEIGGDTYGSTVRVVALEQAVSAALERGLDRRQQLAVEVAERMTMNPHTLDDDLYAQLEEHFTENEIVSLVFIGNTVKFASCLSITLQLDTAQGSNYPKNLTYEVNRAFDA